MGKEKIAFIVPKIGRERNGYRIMNMPPLGATILATILKQKGHDVIVYDENISPLPEPVPYKEVYAFSIIAPGFSRANQLAKMLKKKYSSKTIAGGPHATLMPEEVLSHGFDAVVKGEGENIIEHIADLEGIVEASPVENLDDLPIPDFSLVYGYNKKKLSELVIGRFTPVHTARGCLNSCEFCSVPSLFGKKIRIQSPDRQAEEILFRYEQGSRHFFFVDDNFSLKKNNRTQFLEKIKGLKIKWVAQDDMKVIKKGNKIDADYLNLLRDSGCSKLMLGIESMDENVLKSYNKNQTPQQIEEAVRTLGEYNIKVHAFCIVGSDEDTPETIMKTVNFCRKYNKVIVTSQFPVLSLIPGTQLYKKMYNRIFSSARENSADYADGSSIVMKPAKMEIEEFKNLYKKIWKIAYPMERLLSSLLRGDLPNAMFTLYARGMGKKLRIPEGVC